MKIIAFCALACMVTSAFSAELPATKSRKVPYQVGILLIDNDSQKSWCSGSLISNEFVLTAAHCTEGVKEATVYLGTMRRQTGDVSFKVDKKNFIPYPGYDDTTIKNDISLIRIPFTNYTENIKAVKLPSADDSELRYDDDVVIISGWNDDSNKSKNKLRLRLGSTSLYAIENDVCRRNYFKFLTENHICTSTFGLEAGCRTDAGGPLVLESTLTQIGVNSYSAPKGCQNAPVVFSRISVCLDWIKQQTGIEN